MQILHFVRDCCAPICANKSNATQNQMAATIGKPERTVKSITVSLQEKGILRRVGGKRDGRWEITDDYALL